MTFQEFQDVLRQDPGRWPLPVRSGVIGVFFVVFAGLMLYFLVWTQNKDELAQYQLQEQKLRDEFHAKHGKAMNLDLYKEQLAQIRDTFGTMLRQLPVEAEVRNLLTDISQTSSSAGCQLRKFDPQPEETKDFYAVTPVKLRFTCSYHQMGGFVSGIAVLQRIITLHDVSIRQADKTTGIDQLQLDVTARTYRYLDDSEVAAAEAAKKATTTRGSSSS